MPDLRQIWPTLSPRQRDALCAQGLGDAGRRLACITDPAAEAIIYSSESWIDAEMYLQDQRRHGRCLTYEIRPLTVHRPFSSTWEGAGQLIAALEAGCWCWGAANVEEGYGVTVFFDGHGPEVATAMTFPEVVALAFCLAMAPPEVPTP